MLNCLMATEISISGGKLYHNKYIFLDGEVWIFKSGSIEPFYRTCAYADI